MDTRDKDIRFLKRYAIGSTTLIVLMAITAFVRQPQKQKFGEIDVERINIVEPDGKLRLVISNRPSLKPGTRLVRSWNGKVHHVLVLDDGFEYEARRFSSLTQIATAITGTHWSGPSFFGLPKRKLVSREPRQ